MNYKTLIKYASNFWEDNPDWDKDEDLVNRFYNDKMLSYIADVTGSPGNTYANDYYWKNEANRIKAHKAIDKFNVYNRNMRHSDESAALLDRYVKLRADGVRKDYIPLLYKSDRLDSLDWAWNDLESERQTFKDQKEADKLQKEIESYLYNSYYNPEEVRKEPLTRKDVGSIADATPKQLEKWKRDSKANGLWGAIGRGVAGIGLGAGAGYALGNLDYKANPVGHNAASFLGVAGGLLGAVPALAWAKSYYDKVKKDKEYAQRRLDEK